MNTSSPRRPRRSAAAWAALVAQSFKSELSTERFCADAGISTASLYAWRKKLQPTPERIGFTPVVAVKQEPGTRSSEPCTFEIELRNGRIVRVIGGEVDVGALRAVVTVAEGRAAC